jgi:ABC-type Fe3+/spermidine/putrescine transport system ATPase subunit
LLRILAGFETPDRGTVALDGKDLVAVPANQRPVNMMFQSYALFPHMTVEGNVSYGLEMEGVKGAELKRRVAEALAMVQLDMVAGRKPHLLSGGQRQRVALARALVKRPRLLLLDEPLAALDRKLRQQMQLELKRLQHEVGITFVIVTHDQEEALVMADRIALMDKGRVAQLGSPREIYDSPANLFAADFIGAMIFLAGRRVAGGIEVPGLGLVRIANAPAAGDGTATAAVRPEKLQLALERGGAENAFPATVEAVAFFGDEVEAALAAGDGGAQKLKAKLGRERADALGLAPGKRLWVGFAAGAARLLDK